MSPATLCTWVAIKGSVKAIAFAKVACPPNSATEASAPVGGSGRPAPPSTDARAAPREQVSMLLLDKCRIEPKSCPTLNLFGHFSLDATSKVFGHDDESRQDAKTQIDTVRTAGSRLPLAEALEVNEATEFCLAA